MLWAPGSTRGEGKMKESLARVVCNLEKISMKTLPIQFAQSPEPKARCKTLTTS